MKKTTTMKKLIPGPKVTVKEFQRLLFEEWQAYPMMRINYRKNQLEVVNRYCDHVDITLKKLIKFCDKLNVKYEVGYVGWVYSKAIIINME